MPTLAAFLFGIAGSLAKRVLFALGFGVITFTGLSVAINSIVSLIQTNYGNISAVPYALLNIAGAGQAFGILIAAVITKVSMMTLKKMVLQ